MQQYILAVLAGILLLLTSCNNTQAPYTDTPYADSIQQVIFQQWQQDNLARGETNHTDSITQYIPGDWELRTSDPETNQVMHFSTDTLCTITLGDFVVNGTYWVDQPAHTIVVTFVSIEGLPDFTPYETDFPVYFLSSERLIFANESEGAYYKKE